MTIDIDWKDAPEWANYVSQNEDLTYAWHELEPYIVWMDRWRSDGRSETYGFENSNWKKSLQKRPKEIE